jgi:hypothetical protein
MISIGKSMPFIQNPYEPLVGKLKSIPNSGGMDVRPPSPRVEASEVLAIKEWMMPFGARMSMVGSIVSLGREIWTEGEAEGLLTGIGLTFDEDVALLDWVVLAIYSLKLGTALDEMMELDHTTMSIMAATIAILGNSDRGMYVFYPSRTVMTKKIPYGRVRI